MEYQSAGRHRREGGKSQTFFLPVASQGFSSVLVLCSVPRASGHSSRLLCGHLARTAEGVLASWLALGVTRVSVAPLQHQPCGAHLRKQPSQQRWQQQQK